MFGSNGPWWAAALRRHGNSVHVLCEPAAEVPGQNARPDQFKVSGCQNQDQPILIPPVTADEWLGQLREIKACLKNHAFTVGTSPQAGQALSKRCEYGGFHKCLCRNGWFLRIHQASDGTA